MDTYILIPDGDGAYFAYAVFEHRNVPLPGRYHRIHSGAWVSDTVDHSIEPHQVIIDPHQVIGDDHVRH
jgi:hypothetical protein